MAAGNNLDPNPLVVELVRNPEKVPNVAVLVGFPGAAARPSHFRLYRSLTLDAYVEAPQDRVLAARRLGTADWDPTAVWVAADAPMHTHESATAASYASGSIASEHLAFATAGRAVFGQVTRTCGIPQPLVRPAGGGTVIEVHPSALACPMQVTNTCHCSATLGCGI